VVDGAAPVEGRTDSDAFRNKALGAVTLSTKIQAPGRRRILPRAALVNRLRSGVHKLTLLDAPPGWGKTTLLTAWNANPLESRRFAWLALEAADNDPVRFWTYVIESLRTVWPDIGGSALTALVAPGAGVVDDVLPELINDLATRNSAVLVMDDFHLISRPEITDAVGFLIDHLPDPVSLVLATRSDPPLPLGRLRAQGELLEIRAHDLRFDEDETGALLKEVLGLHLLDDDVRRLHKRTEGWAAGVCLAALSLRSHSDVSGFIDDFAGDDRHIVDFLGAEVLAAQPPDVLDFLLRTSVLERLCGPLCDAVMGRESSSLTLQEIERSNLFLLPLDRTRTWYRYHHLFGELLRHELRRTHPEFIPRLHARAAEWHTDAGSVSAAISHATSAGNIALASRLITEHWYGYLQRGRIQTVASWLEALGDEIVADDPRLCLTKAWLGINTGRLDELGRWIDAAEAAAASHRVHDGASMVETGTASLRAIHRYMSGDVEDAIVAGRRALELERRGQTSPWHPVGCPVFGIALFWSGRSTEAMSELEKAVQEAIEGGNNLSHIHALGGLAAIVAEQGRLQDASAFAGTAARVSGENDLRDHWATTLSLVVEGLMLVQLGNVRAADDVISRGVELSERGIARLEIAFARLALARVRGLQGDFAAALELVANARRTIEKCPEPGILPDLLRRGERALRLAPKQKRPLPERDRELSGREREILRLLPSDLTQREIAQTLFVSANTVKTHMRTIFRKLDASSRSEAVVEAHRRGLL
jgi:LuxR family maltose regulon positive regulatory protein